jgi:Tfp pilus assembly PilM family ATPase
LARYLALDWDQNQLHVIAADVRGKAVRVQKAVVWADGQAVNPAEAEAMGKLLKEKLREAKIAPAPVLACVGRDRVIVKEVRFPAVPDGEEPAVVRFQTVKELTDAPEDVVIDYVGTGSAATGEKKASSLIIRRELLKAYQAVCQAAGLRLVGLTPRLVGIGECLRRVMGTTVVTPAPEPADGVVAVAVAFEKVVELAILKGDTFLLTRSLPAGANTAGDLRRNLAVYAGQNPGAPVVAVYLAGKGAPELRERLAEVTDVPVHTFDPFAGAELAQLPAGNRGSFAGAMGLLFSKAGGQLPINFVAPRQPRPPANPNVRLGVMAGVAVLAFLICLIVGGRVALAMQERKLAEVEQGKKDKDLELAAVRENGKKLKAIDDWDGLVLLDELYELTTRIPDVNKLRITSITIDPLTRTAKSHWAARFTIKGKLLDKRNPRPPFDELVSRFSKEGYYSVEGPRVDGEVFTLTVNAERRAPGEYTGAMSEDYKEAAKAPTKGGKKGAVDKGEETGEETPAEKGGERKKTGKKKGRNRPGQD